MGMGKDRKVPTKTFNIARHTLQILHLPIRPYTELAFSEARRLRSKRVFTEVSGGGLGLEKLGIVVSVNGSRAQCSIDLSVLSAIRAQSQGDATAHSISSFIKIRSQDQLIFGSLVSLDTSLPPGGKATAEVELIGQGTANEDGRAANFTRGVNAYPHPGDEVAFCEEQDFAVMFSPEGEDHVHIGTVYPSAGVRAPILTNRFLGRHFAIVGSSGAGKSTLTAMLLNRITADQPNAHVIVLDPHGEYSRSFGSAAKIWNVDNLRLPYWMMNLEEHCDALLPFDSIDRATDSNILAKCLLAARARTIGLGDSRKLTADSPVPYRLADLTEALEEESGKLEKLADASRYTRIRLNILQYFADPRFSFIFNAEYADESIEQTISDILRLPTDGQPFSVLDLTGVPTEIINVVVASIARMVLDFAIWAPREEKPPFLFVCEEAHRYLPRTVTPATRSVVRQVERIAREGRKYGVCLGLVTQRPSELSETALSQCGTMISLRLNNKQDQEFLKASIPESARSYIEVIPALRNRECIVSGEGVPVTLRVRIDNLEEALRPSSADPEFTSGWSRQQDAPALVEKGVRRWRGMN